MTKRTKADETVERYRFIRPREVSRMTGLSTRQLKNMEAQGRFPARFQLGERSVGWKLIEVVEWINERTTVWETSQLNGEKTNG